MLARTLNSRSNEFANVREYSVLTNISESTVSASRTWLPCPAPTHSKIEYLLGKLCLVISKYITTLGRVEGVLHLDYRLQPLH